MAVPSSGELSLVGIALEMSQNLYQGHVATPSNQGMDGNIVGPTSNYPQATGDNGFYHPAYFLYEEDHANYGNPTAKSRDNTPPTNNNPFSSTDSTNARGLADISLGGMSSTSYGYSSGVCHPILNPAPRTAANEQTYQPGPTGLASGTSTTSTIMYTIYRGSSGGTEAYLFSSSTVGPSSGGGGPDKAVFVGRDAVAGDTHPQKSTTYTNVHPADIGINTANPSANRPDAAGSGNSSAMSEWYDYDHDFVASASPGVYMGSALFSGNGSTTLYTYNIDLSDPDYAGAPVVGVSTTNYIIFAYKNGGPTPPSINFFRGDVQVTSWSANGTLEPFAPPYPSSPLEKWQTSTQPAINPRDPLPATPANAISVYNFVPSWTTVPGPSTTAGRWNYKTGSTPSGGTGVTDPGGYMYTETSSGAFGRWYIARNNIGAATSNDIQLQLYRNGGNIGTLFVGIQIV